MGKRKAKAERQKDHVERVISAARRAIRSGFRDLICLLADSESEWMRPQVRRVIQEVIQEVDGKLWSARLKLALAEKDLDMQKERLARLYPGAGKRLKRLNKEFEKLKKAEAKVIEQLSLFGRSE